MLVKMILINYKSMLFLSLWDNVAPIESVYDLVGYLSDLFLLYFMPIKQFMTIDTKF